MNEEKVDVSVCVAIYNSNLSQLLKTLSSIIGQKDVRFEIIIADDGSKIDLSPQIQNYFSKRHFQFYRILRKKENKGTVKNFFEAAKASNGRYIKCIAPGDLLYSEDSLFKLLKYMQTNKLDACFSNAAYYNDEHKIILPQVLVAPQEVNCYSNNKIALQKLYCLVLQDYICGATFMVSKEAFLYYLGMIIDKVLYSEDSIYRIMVFDEKKIGYYETLTMYYHYGDGISTGRNSKWIQLLYNDNNALNKILLKKCQGKNFFEKRFKVLLKYCDSKISSRNKVLKTIIFPESFIMWCKLKLNKRLNTKDASFDFYKMCESLSNEYEEKI